MAAGFRVAFILKHLFERVLRHRPEVVPPLNESYTYAKSFLDSKCPGG